MAASEIDIILRNLGRKKVHFRYPGSEGELIGILKDRCVLPAGTNLGCTILGCHRLDYI